MDSRGIPADDAKFPRGSDRGNFLTPSGEISCDPPQSNRVRREALVGPAIRLICRRLEFGLRLVGGAHGGNGAGLWPPSFRRPRTRPTEERAAPLLDPLPPTHSFQTVYRAF